MRIVGVFAVFLTALLAAQARPQRAEYCTDVGNTSDRDSAIGKVLLQGEGGTAITSDRLCNVTGLRDLTGEQNANLVRGKVYTLSFVADTCGAAYTRFGKAWIDWYGVGWSGSDPATSQLVLSGSGGLTSFVINGTFTVPADAPLGKTRLRIELMETSDVTKVVPCAQFTFGGTNDYSVTVLDASKWCSDVGASKSTGPAVGVLSLLALASDKVCMTGLRDLTSQVAVVRRGWTYTLTWAADTCGVNSTFWAKAWIDWYNKGWNGTSGYDSSVISSQSGVTPTTMKATFVVPSDAPIGDTRLRVMLVETTSYSKVYPCAKFDLGGVTDYTITVKDPASYCMNGPSSAYGSSAIGAVTLIGDSGTSIKDTKACTAGVADKTDRMVTLKRGGSYLLNWTADSGCYSAGTPPVRWAKAWIDWYGAGWTGSGTFDDDIISTQSGGPGTYTISAAFVVPTDALVGKQRLRLMIDETTNFAAVYPCASYSYGGASDYSVNIV